MKNVPRMIFLMSPVAATAAGCPAGHITLPGNDGINLMAACPDTGTNLGQISTECGDSERCAPDAACTAGIHSIRIGTGGRMELTARPYSTPTIHVSTELGECHANLAPGRHWNHQHSIKRQCLPCGIQPASVFDDKCRRRRIRTNARGPNRKLDSPQWGHRHRRDFALRNNIGQFGQNRSHIEYQRSCHQQHLLLVQNGKASADRVDIWCRIYPRRYVRRIMRANMCEKFHGKCDLSRGAV